MGVQLLRRQGIELGVWEQSTQRGDVKDRGAKHRARGVERVLVEQPEKVCLKSIITLQVRDGLPVRVELRKEGRS